MNKLKKKAVKGVKWSAISSGVLAILQILQISILTKYLDPSAFGIMAIVFVVIGFSSLFMDLGVSAAIISFQDLSNKQLSSLYWINIIFGFLIALLVFLSSPFVSDFYKESELQNIIKILSITFILSAIGSQYKIIKQKEMNFNLISKVEIFSSVISFISVVTTAYFDLGVYSLVVGALVQSLISNILFFSLGFGSYKLSLTLDFLSIKPMIIFGFYQMGEKCLNYINSQLDVIIIGKILGADVLGLYSISKNLVMKPAVIINPIITKVGFPLMASIQGDIHTLRKIYLKTVNYLSTINFLVYGSIIVLAEFIVNILFGEKWVDAIPVIQFLSVYFMLRSISNPVGSLQLAKGRADLGFYWNLLVSTFTPIMIYIGSKYGVNGITISLIISQLILNIPCWRFLVYPLCGANLDVYLKSIWGGLRVSILALLPCFIIYQSLYEHLNLYINSFIYILLAAILSLFSIKKLNYSLYDSSIALLKRR